MGKRAPQDRFLNGRLRGRQADAIAEERENFSITRGVNRESYRQWYARLLEEQMQRPEYQHRPGDRYEKMLAALNSPGAYVHRGTATIIRFLRSALDARAKGLEVTKKPKLPKPSVERFKRNVAAFDAMTAARPLKPPGRR